MFRIKLLLLSLMIMMLAAACGGDATSAPNDVGAQSVNPTDSSTPVPSVNNDAGDTLSDDAVASVNGVSITQNEFDRAFVRIAGNSTAADNSALATEVLNTLIEQEVIAQAAAKMGITVTDADVDAEVDSLKQELGNNSWEGWLASNQYTEPEFREALQNSIITNRVRDSVIAELGQAVEHVHARHILVSTEAEAQSVLDRLAAGEDFSALAAELSLDQMTRDFGGDLGWFIREELLDEKLADAAFALGEGEISQPIATRLGYHILQTIEKEERVIEPERMPLLVQTIFNRWLENEMLSATIVRNQ